MIRKLAACHICQLGMRLTSDDRQISKGGQKMSEKGLTGGMSAESQLDLGSSVVALLRLLFLLPDGDADASGVSSIFKGPPTSVALIEANATAFSKYWAAGIGLPAFVAGAFTFWKAQDGNTQTTFVWAAAVCVAAAVLAIGYIVGSDVRGRSSAAVATIHARATVATQLAKLYADADVAATTLPNDEVIALPAALQIRNIAKRGDTEELGWRAIAARVDANSATRYLVVKGGEMEWVGAEQIEFL